MKEISLLTGELIFAAVWIAVRVILWIKRGRIDWKREALLLIMFINLAVIIRFAFYPFSKVNGRVQPLVYDPEEAFPFRINLVPFAHITEYETRRDVLINIIGNITMFIPSGIVLPILYKRLNGFWKVVAAGACISLAIEILQLPFAVRASDIDDLILNTAGVAIGYGIYALVRRIFKKPEGVGSAA